MKKEKELNLPAAAERAADAFNAYANAIRFTQQPNGAYTPKRSTVIKNKQRRKQKHK